MNHKIYKFKSTFPRAIHVVLDRSQDYEGGTPVIVELYEGGTFVDSATWNCIAHEGAFENHSLTLAESAWIDSITNDVNAFLESLEFA
jgi:hypothetical protein